MRHFRKLLLYGTLIIPLPAWSAPVYHLPTNTQFTGSDNQLHPLTNVLRSDQINQANGVPGLDPNGNLTISAFATFSSSPNLTATGSTISNALVLTSAFNTLKSVPANSGVVLSPIIPVNAFVTIYNNDPNNTVLVYPPNDNASQIESKGVGVGISLISGGYVRLFHESTTEWRAN